MTDQTTQTPTNENADAETHEPGSDEAAIAALLAQDTDEPAPDDEPEADPDAEPDEGEPEDEEPEEELVEVEGEDGKTYKVPPEVQKAMLRQADYSRKMNAVAAQEKQATQTKETADRLLEGAEKYAEALSEVTGIDRELKRYDTVKWAELRAENPAEYAALSADLNTLRLSREAATRKAQGLDAEIQQSKTKLHQGKRDEMVKALEKDLKGWGEKLGTEITAYAIENGHTREEIAQVTDPKWVIAQFKAMKYDALQKGKADLKAKVKDVPPVLKPGSTRRPNVQQDAMALHRKHQSAETAEALFLARMK